MKKKDYQKPEMKAIEIAAEQCILGYSQSAPVGGDTDPDDPNPWV